jgi:2-polyprenyl-3-methyl-5-hydroxy-6-metoxy-1,4-benzoquinol methylase
MKCLLCGSQNHNVFNRVESFGVPLVYLQCEQCGLVFQSKEKSQAWESDFYAETYRRVYQESVTPTAKDLWVQDQRATNLIHFLNQNSSKRLIRILDIGASTGRLLESFQRFFHCDVMGVEPGDAYRAYAEAKGMRMVPSLEAVRSESDWKFDLVSLVHVLEHLPDPLGTLKIIKEELLKEGGFLLLEVPNFYAHDSYELAHLTCYTPHILREMVKQAGFRVIKLQRHGIPRSELLHLYLTVLAEPSARTEQVASIQPERNVRLKRRMSFLYRRLIQKFFPHRAWLPLPEEKLV